MNIKAVCAVLCVTLPLAGMELPEQSVKGTITVVVDDEEFKDIPREKLKHSRTITQMLEEFEDIEKLDLSPLINPARFKNVCALLNLLNAEKNVEAANITTWDIRVLSELIEDIERFQIDDEQKQVSKLLRESNNMRVHLLRSCKIPHSFCKLGEASGFVHYRKFCLSPDERQATFYGREILAVTNFDQNLNTSGAEWKALEKKVSSVCYSGAHLILGFQDGTLLMFDNFNGVRNEHSLSGFVGHTQAISSLCCHPSKEAFVSASHDTTVKLWNIHTRDSLYTFEGHAAPVNCVCCSTDGETIASCSQDNTVRLWSVSNGKQRAVLTGHAAPVYWVCFNPNGITLTSCSQDGTIRCWDSIAQKELSQFNKGTKKKMKQCCYSSDGNLFVASNATGIYIWDVMSGKKITVLKRGLNYYVRLSCDGRHIFALQWPCYDSPQITWPILCVWDISDLNFVNTVDNFTLSQTLLLQLLEQKAITHLQVKRNTCFSAILNKLSPFIQKKYGLGILGSAAFKLSNTISLGTARFKSRR